MINRTYLTSIIIIINSVDIIQGGPKK